MNAAPWMDVVNACFEFCGALAILPSIAAIRRDRAVAGMSVITPIFFAAWGWWNLAYYPHLHQLWSAGAAVSTALLNSIYVGYVMRTKRRMEEAA